MVMRDRDPRHSYEAHLLATAAGLDVRSSRKALRQGPQSLRGRAGARAALAMRDLGLVQWAADDAPVEAKS